MSNGDDENGNGDRYQRGLTLGERVYGLEKDMKANTGAIRELRGTLTELADKIDDLKPVLTNYNESRQSRRELMSSRRDTILAVVGTVMALDIVPAAWQHFHKLVGG